MTKYVYAFEEGNKEMKNLLGGKGANLAEMISIGLPVPNGFTITTESCNNYYENNQEFSSETIAEIWSQLENLEKKTGKKMGDLNNPLLVSVRSGARASMPGMMDTVLNLGLNDQVVEGLAQATNNPRFAYDSYRRFIQMFSDVVMGYSKASFERFFDKIKEEKHVNNDTELTAEDLKEVVNKFKANYLELAKEEFPQDPKEQLMAAIKAVFRSWNNERAILYRRLNDIPASWGTAVNVQEMVYGNRGNDCGTGVAFTRNPSTGENKLYGEYLINAQGEDVVAGIRTPQDIETLKDIMPEVYEEFVKITHILEEHYRDMQDMEFTIENSKLFMLQTRNGKRTAAAALKIAVDLVEDGTITKEEALLRVDPRNLDQLLHPNFDVNALKSSKTIAKGLAASPGAATGKIFFTAEDVVSAKKNGEKEIILVRLETSPEDIQGMNDANGILTIRGGMTSHAAVVARGMGRCCITGCGELKIDEENKKLITKDGTIYNEGDYLSLDGSTGLVYGEKINTTLPEISGDFEKFMSWADSYRTLEVRTNADTPKDAKQALAFGAQGIGLCRTEHMFFDENRIFAMRQMITANSVEKREEALSKILPYQRQDFEELFKVMKGFPVTIRYLDPPLHEFLPHTEEEIKALATSLEITYEELKNRINSLHEFNPMMGHRGCRLSVTYPEIARMQTRAVIEAAINVAKEGLNVIPEIMIPLVGDINELKYIKAIVTETADTILKENNSNISYKVGTMIEIPRAALTADVIAEEAEFFSFGTNDLTQMTFGFSRDDASTFLEEYYSKGIFESDPFAKLDQIGVGQLVKIAVEKGKATRPDIKLGICGEHGGDPATIEFCHKIGLKYVSCSPFRVPIARLAAAQAAIKSGTKKN
ncbi:MAG: pyruvate, phosphate dikinase [Mollicutes bacterium]|nr:pyruvate, phosphate dikinase [Mollicutes bacterium]